jgi:ABC-type multidrug transport system ATPase subunit
VSALEAQGVGKTYGELVALAPLDLKIEEGQTVGLIGHNGSGKTTFLRLASGLLEASEGKVVIAGEDAGSLNARASLSFIPDNPVLYDDLSVWEHLQYIARLHGVDGWEGLAEELVERLKLEHRVDDLPVTFSRGLRQKVSIAVGLIRPFDVLLVDEPFVGLDPSGQETMVEMLGEVAGGGAAVVVATHQLDFLRRCDRCVGLRDGTLVYDGPADRVDPTELVS